jgi:hypothetical protein
VDGDRPPLPDGERLDALVGADKWLKRAELEPAVGMGNVGPSQPIDARVPSEVALRDLGQQTVVASREVVPNVPDLFVHGMEVVEEPLRGGCDLPVLLHRFGNVPVCGQKYPCVLVDPGEEIPSSGELLGSALGRGQALGMLLQTLDTEDLGADRFFPQGWSDDDSVRGVDFELPFRFPIRVPSYECQAQRT